MIPTRWLIFTVSAALAIMTLLSAAGCNSSKPEKPIVLRVNYPFENRLYQQYGYAFEKQHPNIRIEAVDLKLDKALYPDIVFMTSLDDYKQQIEQEKLVSLEPIIARDREGGELLKRLSPIVTDMLRSSDNQLYALSAYYSSGGLFYNIDLFQKYGVPFPTNRMSWSEVLQLAARFPDRGEQGKPLFGFATNYYEDIVFSLFLEAGETEGLSFIHPKTLDISIDTEKWGRLYESVIRSASDGGIYNRADAGGADPLYTGEAAMQLKSENAPVYMEQAAKFYKLDPIHWGVVTAPVNPERPEYSNYYSLYGIFGISADTRYKDEAWEFIKFAVGNTDNIRRNMARGDGMIPAIQEVELAVDGHDMSALTMQLPEKAAIDPYDEVPYEIINAFKAVGEEVTERAIRGELSASEALREIERKGQLAVDEAKIALAVTNAVN
ncbi:ABC transporter substrate-binding protein [Paenibacillus xylaniclasticus]|uniref:ABC transporter substrate-binding protein n=1 Tax=Paenibacillus xylaniclasticus TaxID=588083 RepID=UPI0013DF5E11|nr:MULTISPECIES: ABC transporter substrate-binding protein [Paenibacillus]GFN33126.1 sugar ABC transporter substrate-binding protein [Paenibacillus curdlanolyticus]